MKVVITLIFLFFFGYGGYSQAILSKADSLRTQGRLDLAILAYKEDLKKNPTDYKTNYNIACAYALINSIDSSFYYLERAMDYDNTLYSLVDSDFFSLIEDSRWNSIEKKQIKKFQDLNGIISKEGYALKLLRIILKDQALDFYIKQARDFFVNYNFIPFWYYPLQQQKAELVEENFLALMRLIDKHGWPKYSSVGKLAADAPLLCINHHLDDAIRKKYITIIKKSCLENEGSCLEYAKIRDRILVNDGNEQLYGMQFKYNIENKLEPFPIKDPQFVDKRRAEIGLEPIKIYLKRKINYEWNIPQKN